MKRTPPGLARGAVIALTLLSAGFFGAYLRWMPAIQRDATYTDGERSIDLADADDLRFAVWDQPVPLPPVINTHEAEGRAALSPDGQLLVFAVGQRGLNADLWVAEMVDGEPTDPRPLQRVNGPFDELAPAFGADAFYFASNRPGGAGGLDVYRAPYADGVFGPVEALAPGVNTSADECDPAPWPGTDSLVFASNRPRGRRTDYDLWVAEPAGAARDEATPQAGARVEPADGAEAPDGANWRVVPFEALNTPFDEREPAFTGDGLGVVLASDRDGTLGGFDLWRSVRNRGEWLVPEPIPGINSFADERGPAPSEDGFTLLFSAQLPDGDSDLYRSRSVELFRVPGRPVGWIDMVILALLLLVALLAWLGKRWEALDILYKCVLVSLVVHLGLMLWFREVEMEREAVELGPSSPTFKVRLSTARTSPAASRERHGELELSRTMTDAAGAPERHQAESDRSPSVQAGAASLPTPSLAQAAAPERQAVEHTPAEQQSAAAVRPLALQEHSEQAARLSADAPALTVVARRAPSPERSNESSSSRPTRRVAAAETSAVADAGPTSRALSMPETSRGPAAPGPRSTDSDRVERAAQSNAAARSVALAAPDSAPAAERANGKAPELALDALAAATGDVTPSRGPARPSRLVPSSLDGAANTSTTASTPGASSLPLSTADIARAGPSAPDRQAADHAQSRSGRPRPEVSLSTPGAAATPADERAERPGVAAATSTTSEPTDLLGEPSSLAVAPSGRVPGRPGGPQRPGRYAAPGNPTSSQVDPGFTPLVAAMTAEPEAGPDSSAQEWEHTPYRTRFGDAKVEAIEEHGGNQETEQAVAAGLAYLASKQSNEGFWGSPEDFDDKYGHVAVGKTALALLAFLGAGHTPTSGTQYTDVTVAAVDFLLAVQDADTGHFGYNTSYSHGITTYALAECFALTRDEQLRAPLERAVSWLLQNQNRSSDRRRFGGWGYYYPDGRTYDAWPRSSITAWQVMALESARLAGLAVPDRAFADARSFLRYAHRLDAGVILYSQDPERTSSTYWTLPGSTPAGLFALSLLGEDITSSRYSSTIDFVTERAPGGFVSRGSDAFVFQATGNLYFWYYGTLTMFRHGGQEWTRWNRRLQSTLLPSQNGDGSWEPISLYADYAGDDEDDKSYSTAMCVLTLEVYYRYFTPLLQVR